MLCYAELPGPYNPRPRLDSRRSARKSDEVAWQPLARLVTETVPGTTRLAPKVIRAGSEKTCALKPCFYETWTMTRSSTTESDWHVLDDGDVTGFVLEPDGYGGLR